MLGWPRKTCSEGVPAGGLAVGREGSGRLLMGRAVLETRGADIERLDPPDRGGMVQPLPEQPVGPGF